MGHYAIPSIYCACRIPRQWCMGTLREQLFGLSDPVIAPAGSTGYYCTLKDDTDTKITTQNIVRPNNAALFLCVFIDIIPVYLIRGHRSLSGGIVPYPGASFPCTGSCPRLEFYGWSEKQWDRARYLLPVSSVTNLGLRYLHHAKFLWWPAWIVTRDI